MLILEVKKKAGIINTTLKTRQKKNLKVTQEQIILQC